jgi:plasmid stabilization system protein ParE
LNILATFPEAGRLRPEIGNYRSYPVHPFVVFYRVDDVERSVTIRRVLDGALDLEHDILLDDATD